MIRLMKLLFSKSDIRPQTSHINKAPVVVWNITRRCNLACLHCYINAGKVSSQDELTTPEAHSLISDLAAMGARALLFSGGEPLLREDIFHLGKTAREAGIRPVLSTNGTLITPKVAKELRRAGFAYVGVSIDGSPETHNYLRGREGAFQSAIQGLRNVRAAGLKTGLRFTIFRRNFQDLEFILNIVEKEQIPRFCMYHLVYAGRGSELAQDDLSPQETRQAMEHLLERARDWHRRGLKIETLTAAGPADGVFIERLVAHSDPERLPEVRRLLRLHAGCSAGCQIAAISAQGSVHPCQFWQEATLGNVREQKFSQIWQNSNNELLHKLRNISAHLEGPRCKNCEYKSICGGCRVRALYTYGSPWADDPGCYLSKEEIFGPKQSLTSDFQFQT